MTSGRNPFIESEADELEDTAVNPLLEDDDEEELVAPLRLRLPNQSPSLAGGVARSKTRTEPTAAAVVAPSEKPIEVKAVGVAQREPQFGEPGYGKGRKFPNRVGTPRARVTDKDEVLLAFLGKLQVARADALTQLLMAEKAPNGRGSKNIVAISTVEARLEKLKKLGMVESFFRPGLEPVWSVTEHGGAFAQIRGYLTSDGEWNPKTAADIKSNDMTHRLAVSHVAAQLTSPRGYFKELLKLNPVPFENLISEYALRRWKTVIHNDLRAIDAERGAPVMKSGGYRTERLRKAVNEVEAGLIEWEDLLEFYPDLWTLGEADKTAAEGYVRSEHYPDLVVSREAGRTGEKSKSFFVEVELNKKSQDVYEKILRTYANEFEHGLVYCRVLYFTNSTEVKNLITKVDKRHSFGLLKSGRLVFAPIKARDGRSDWNTENTLRDIAAGVR